MFFVAENNNLPLLMYFQMRAWICQPRTLYVSKNKNNFETVHFTRQDALLDLNLEPIFFFFFFFANLATQGVRVLNTPPQPLDLIVVTYELYVVDPPLGPLALKIRGVRAQLCVLVKNNLGFPRPERGP